MCTWKLITVYRAWCVIGNVDQLALANWGTYIRPSLTFSPGYALTGLVGK